MKRYRIAEGKEVIVTIYNGETREAEQYRFGRDDGIEFEVEGSDMWALGKGKRYLTEDHPVAWIAQGWIEEVKETDD